MKLVIYIIKKECMLQFLEQAIFIDQNYMDKKNEEILY